jgi:hypothetical protein
MRNGHAGLGTSTGQPVCLYYGEVYTAGSHIRWSNGTATDPGCGGSWSLQASADDDDAVTVAAGGCSGSNLERGVAQLPGAGFRKVEVGLWAQGRGVVAGPASIWYVTSTED